MTNDEIGKALDEIVLYFYGCYRNAGGGTKACEKFHNWMCAVGEAKKLIAAAPTFGGWISIKDRLPDIISKDFDEYSDDVLVVTPDGIKIGHCEPCGDGEYEWCSNWDSISVTHWMPLPEPPEELMRC